MLVVFIVIQFIQPAHNITSQVLPTDIHKMYAVPDSVNIILQNSCYDCHSNNTRYPWYSFIQPGAWWMASHIKKGKADLNFSDFGSYSKRKQQSKFKAINNSVKDETMPLSSYTLMHPKAKLSGAEKKVIMDWAIKIKDSISENY